ncbi:MAG: TIGR01777 family oxidoreductase [Enhygromyxa sp.]
MHRFERRLKLPVSRAELFAWHARPGAFERLSPSWERLEIVAREGSIKDGDRLHFRLRKGPIGIPWIARHRDYLPGRRFVDVAECSPFAAWEHTHAFVDAGPGAAELRDQVGFRLPLDRLSWPLAGRRVEAMLDRMFRQRHVRTANDLRRHQAVADRGPLRVAVSGASGLVGSELQAFLTTGGHTVVPLVRSSKPRAGQIAWDPQAGVRDPAVLERFDAVVHLAGESIAERWTPTKRERIRSSRVAGTRSLCEALARLEHKPEVLVCASAIGLYGDAGEAELDEDAPAGEGFLAELAREWEAATEPARAAGIRVVKLRIGIVMSARGGALAKLRLPLRLGLGGPVGDGRQWQSWIDLDDLVGVIHHALFERSLRGPVNAVAPTPVRQAELARTLGRVLRRPAILPLPAPVVRALFGELGREVLLAGQRVRCDRLLASGFRFDFPALEDSLRHQLGRADADAVARAVGSFEARTSASSAA